MKRKLTLRQITLTGLMAAAVYVASAFLQIPIPTAIDNTRLHMGNVMCLLSGLLLGPWQGGLAAGIGSMFFDLTNPAYIASAPFTFLFKFLMVWACGKIAFLSDSASPKPECGTDTPSRLMTQNIMPRRSIRFLTSALCGSALYVILYLSKSFAEHYFVLNLPLEAVLLTLSQKAIVSSVNAVVAVCVAVPLGLSLGPVIRKFT